MENFGWKLVKGAIVGAMGAAGTLIGGPIGGAAAAMVSRSLLNQMGDGTDDHHSNHGGDHGVHDIDGGGHDFDASTPGDFANVFDIF